jgi:hypothetical protein
MSAPRLPEPPFSLKDLLQPVPGGGTSSVNTPEEMRAMRDRAAQDLTDIRALRNDEPFQRFFLRRVRQKRDQAMLLLLTDKCDAATREGHRQKALALEEVLTLLEDDDKAARNLMG